MLILLIIALLVISLFSSENFSVEIVSFLLSLRFTSLRGQQKLIYIAFLFKKLQKKYIGPSINDVTHVLRF